jgi:hypothetical protein
MCVHDCLLPLKAANIVSFLTPQRSESGQRNGEDSLTDRCRQQPERAWLAFVDPLQFRQKQLLQRFVHQVVELAERQAEFSEVTVRDQL